MLVFLPLPLLVMFVFFLFSYFLLTCPWHTNGTGVVNSNREAGTVPRIGMGACNYSSNPTPHPLPPT